MTRPKSHTLLQVTGWKINLQLLPLSKPLIVQVIMKEKQWWLRVNYATFRVISRYPKTSVVEVKNPLQSLEASSMCGFYAAAFILSQDVQVEEKFEDFVARYTAPKNNLIANDKIAVNYIIEFIHLYGVKKK